MLIADPRRQTQMVQEVGSDAAQSVASLRSPSSVRITPAPANAHW